MMSIVQVLLCWSLTVTTSTVSGIHFAALDHIKPSASPETQRQAAQDLIGRVLGNDAHHFKVVAIDPQLGPAHKDTFLIQSDGKTVSISATSGVAAALGFYHYLKTHCGCLYTWAGSQLKLPHPLPLVPSPGLKITTNDRFRYYQNVCTVSYSMVWWNWTRWEREIDWMAMHGINLPLAFTGQEAIFQRVYTSLGLTRDDLKEHWGGPAFLAWSRMGNMHGWGGPLPQSWIDNQLALQHQILARMRALGMIPVLPGFAGHVPLTITKYFPNATVTRLSVWGKFNKSYCCTYLLDFEDPLFLKIGTAFINEMKKEFGVDHVYNADSFNEETPASGDPSYLRKAGNLVYKAMSAADPDAIWMIQGWLFAHNRDFWKPPQTEAFLTSVPRGKMLVLDLYAENWPMWDTTNSFYGQPYIWCMLHNFGGTMELYGAIDAINQGPFQARSHANSTMVGIGMTPEGIDQNEAIYEFMSENVIAPAPRNLTHWFTEFATARYGQYNEFAVKAWLLLMGSVFNNTDGLRDHSKGVVPTARPSLKLDPDIWYNPADLHNAAMYMARAGQSLSGSSYFKYDQVDITRNDLQDHAYLTYKIIIDAYHRRDVNTFRGVATFFSLIIMQMDSLLGTDAHFLLGTWLAGSRLHGNTTQERDLLEYNARNQVTLWGPDGGLRDYAAKQWSGLISGYHYPRWQLFIQMLDTSLSQGKPFNQTLYDEITFKTIEQQFTFAHGPYNTHPKGSTSEIVNEWLSNYRSLEELYTTFTMDAHRRGKLLSAEDYQASNQMMNVVTAQLDNI